MMSSDDDSGTVGKPSFSAFQRCLDEPLRRLAQAEICPAEVGGGTGGTQYLGTVATLQGETGAEGLQNKGRGVCSTYVSPQSPWGLFVCVSFGEH